MARATSNKSGQADKSSWSGATMTNTPVTKSRELSAFLFLTVFLAPAVLVMLVGGYGFAVWMYQLIAGPPGAP